MSHSEESNNNLITVIRFCHYYLQRCKKWFTEVTNVAVSIFYLLLDEGNRRINFFLLADFLLRLTSICVWFSCHIFPFRWAFSKGPIHMEQPWRRPSWNLRHPPKLRSKTEPRLQLFHTTGIIITGRQIRKDVYGKQAAWRDGCRRRITGTHNIWRCTKKNAKAGKLTRVKHCYFMNSYLRSLWSFKQNKQQPEFTPVS